MYVCMYARRASLMQALILFILRSCAGSQYRLSLSSYMRCPRSYHVLAPRAYRNTRHVNIKQTIKCCVISDRNILVPILRECLHVLFEIELKFNEILAALQDVE